MPNENNGNVENKVEFRNKWTGGLLTALSLSFLVLTVCVWPTERAAFPELVAAAADRMAKLDAEIAVKAAELAQAQAAEAQPKQGEASGATPQPPQDGGAGGPATLGEAGKAASEGKVAELQAAYDKAIEALASEKARHDKFAASRTTAGLFFGFEGESLLLFIVIFAAALGGSLHALKSFAYYQATGDFKVSYGWWYFARIPVASILGLITYFALRGGVFPLATIDKANVVGVANPHGIAAISALVGMYSGRALRKLGDVFDAIMGEDDIPGKKPAPAIASVSTVKVGATADADLTVTVKLANLDPAKVRVFVGTAERASEAGADKKSRTFKLTQAEAAAAGKIAFTLKDEAGKEYKSEVEIVA